MRLPSRRTVFKVIGITFVVFLVAARLRERGVARVHDSGLCTRCDGSIFHSYRREGKRGGRNLAVLTKSR